VTITTHRCCLCDGPEVPAATGVDAICERCTAEHSRTYREQLAGDRREAMRAVMERHAGSLRTFDPESFTGGNADSRATVLDFVHHVWVRTFGIDELLDGATRLSEDECRALVLGAMHITQQSRKGAWSARARIAEDEIAAGTYALQWSVMQLALINLGWER